MPSLPSIIPTLQEIKWRNPLFFDREKMHHYQTRFISKARWVVCCQNGYGTPHETIYYLITPSLQLEYLHKLPGGLGQGYVPISIYDNKPASRVIADLRKGVIVDAPLEVAALYVALEEKRRAIRFAAKQRLQHGDQHEFDV